MSVTNVVFLIGRLVKDPELKTTSTGVVVTNLTLAVARPKTKDTTDFFPVVAWRSNAEYICNYAKKGTMLGVNGTATMRSYEKNGEKRTVFEIQADDVKILDGFKKAAAPADDVPDIPDVPDPSEEDLPY